MDGLQFAAGPLRWNKEGWLRLPKEEQGPGEELFLNLGVSGGYEVVEVRLFDHATRQLIHDSAWQHPGHHQQNLFVERIGSINWLRMKEEGGTFPDAMDVWLRLATERSGHTFVLPAKFGASASHDGSEVVITTLLAGAMNGKSEPTGEMEWDLVTVHDEDRALTVNIENRGKPLDGRYHLVAVNKDGSRHPMDDTHFRDFRRMGTRAYFRMHVALADVDHFELVPFKDRHKFFFNGLKVPRKEPAEVANLSAAVADQAMRLIQSRHLPFVTEERLRRIGGEFAALVNEHQRDDLSDDRKRAILAGIKAHRGRQPSTANARSLNQTYLEFPDWTKTLKWQVFMAVTRPPLSESDQRRMASQRSWMRGIIAGLPDDRFRSRNDVLKEIEVRFADPLCTSLDRPMTEAQFTKFQKAITTYLREAQTGVNERTPTASRSVKPHNPLPSVIHHLGLESLWAQYHGEKHEYLYPLFDNDPIGGSGAANGHVTLHFMSNRPFLGDSRALGRMETEFSVVDAMNGYPVVAPSNQRDPETFVAWLQAQDAGDFGLSRDAGDSLVAVRGAKLALLNVENWIQADAINDKSLREIIERQNKKQIELTAYYKSWQRVMSGFNGPYGGILTKEGRLAVMHVEDFSGPEAITYRVRARLGEEDGGTPAWGERADGVRMHYKLVRQAQSVSRASNSVAQSAALASSDSRERFLAVEGFARLPQTERVVGVPELYRGLPTSALGMFVEGILSGYPHDILNRNTGVYDGETRLWAQQLAAAASTLTPEQVVTNLASRLWLDVATRARALWVFEQHPNITSRLIAADLATHDTNALQRAATVIQALELKSFTPRLLEIWMADDGLSESVWGALLFLRDPSIVQPLLDRVEKDPRTLVRCAGLFQGTLHNQPVEPVLFKLLDSPDPEIRYQAAYALEECTDSRLAQPVARLVKEPESRSRFAAAHMVAKLPEPAYQSVRSELLPLLSDRDEQVRYYALLSFGKRKDLAAGSVILEALRRDNLAEEYKVWVMQSMSALSGSTWNYYMHEWGPAWPGNQTAIEKCDAWLKAQPAATKAGE